jgi:hypothetical protein
VGFEIFSPALEVLASKAAVLIDMTRKFSLTSNTPVSLGAANTRTFVVPIRFPLASNLWTINGTCGGLRLLRVRTGFNVPATVGVGPERLKRRRSTGSRNCHLSYPGARGSVSLRVRRLSMANFQGR